LQLTVRKLQLPAPPNFLSPWRCWQQATFIEEELLRIASSALWNVVTFLNSFLGKKNICCNGYEYVCWIDFYR